MPSVLVPAARLERWVGNFADRHGAPQLDVADGALHGRAPDGSTFAARLPWARQHGGAADLSAFLAQAATGPDRWGVLLVRKGGFAIARLEADRIVESKVGQRHVQGRTKAGGQSQQRFARRRDNQARDAYRAAADHAARILAPLGRGGLVVTGGDEVAVEEVLADPRLRGLVVVGDRLPVPDPRRAVLEQAVRDAASVSVLVRNAPAGREP